MFSSLSIFSSISDIFRLFSFLLPSIFSYVYDTFPQIRFGSTHSRGCCSEHTFQIDALNCSALPKFFFALVLWLLLTSCRSLLLRISPSARPHGINQYSFLVYLLGLHNRVTVTFGTSLFLANLSAYYAFVPSFCSSGYDFAIPSSRLHLTMHTLGVAFKFVGNYASVDFHHRALICPSYQKRTHPKGCVPKLLKS